MLVLSFLAAGCNSSTQTSDSTVRFYQANSAYKAGDYDAALKLYREITDSGFVSAAVYYNIANCYMKKGELGRALAWYERALRLNPRDSDLRANWMYARSMMKNPEVSAPKNFEDRIFVHLQYVSEDEIIIILCLVIFALSLLVLAGLFLRWRFRKTFFLILLLAGLFIFHVFALLVKMESLADRAVILSTVEVRYEPEEKATTHYTAYEGWKVRVLKESAGWSKVERPDGLTGWLPSTTLEHI